MTLSRKVALFVAALALAAMPFLFSGTALAHNAAHIHLANGECINLGSGQHAHNPDRQDRLPDLPGDQYGARWASENPNTPMYPRHCHEANAHNHP